MVPKIREVRRVMEVKLDSPAPVEVAKEVMEVRVVRVVMEVMEVREVRVVRVVRVCTPYFPGLRGFPHFPHQKISRPSDSRLRTRRPKTGDGS